MSVLTVTSEGHLTLGDDEMSHLGVIAGDLLEVDQLPGGQLRLRAKNNLQSGDSSESRDSLDRFFGSLAGKTTKVATLDEIQRACEAGWAGLVDMG